MPKKLLFSIFCSIAFLCAFAEDGDEVLDGYRRAFNSRQLFGSQNVANGSVSVTWIGHGPEFWYVRDTPVGRQYAKVNADSRKRVPLFDHLALAKSLGAMTDARISPDSLHLSKVRVSEKADTVWFEYGGNKWQFNIRGNRLSDLGAVPDPQPRGRQRHWMEVDDEKEYPPVPSPDGAKLAYIKDNNVWVKDLATGKETRLSDDGTLGNYYSAYISWSPDSRKVASCKIRPEAEKRYVYYVESSPSDQLQPKLHKQEYAKPGDELRFKVPCIFNVETGQAIIPSTELFANQYDLMQPEWTDDSQHIIFDYNERGHKVYRVLQLSAETGQVSTLIEETSDKYVNYPRYFRHNLSDNKRIIWMSERDNWNHLYMYDLCDLTHPRQITKGEWYVRRVINVDEDRGLIYFTANCVDKDEDPYDIKYYRINFDGGDFTCLTPVPGHHSASFSPDMQYIVDIVSTPEMAPVTTLRSGHDGSELMHLETADISRLQASGWHAPEVFAAPGRDGKTLMWGLIQRPSNFDPSKKYPVIEYIYQGPGDQYVPKAFTPYNHWLTPLAELGFIVVMVDGMGTSFRSREFENICYKNLQDAGIPDHIAWIKAAAERYPELDIDRVGIYGCSAGGQESLNALLHYPEFYKACYSACGCHDNRMDKIWWNELWMGYPVDDSYAKASNVENAHLLQRPLMLVVGEFDDNVDPASTMQVVNALIKANKDFELVVIPGARHTMGESYGDHKRYDFFTRTLKSAVPPSWLAF